MVFLNKYEKLMEPYHIGTVKTRNRIIKTGASTWSWHEDELHMNETTKSYYEALARGGVGLLIVESPTIDYPAGARWRARYRIDNDKYIPGLKELTEVIHKHGCPTFMQMNHDGPWRVHLIPGESPVFPGPPVAASAVNLNAVNDFNNDVPRALTIPEIKEIEDKFASAAVRAYQAGFDGVDINAGSSHLFHTFLSPFWNKRQDAYGGSQENRARFLVETIREIKKRLGQGFPVSVLINGIEIGQYTGIDDKECLTAADSRGIALRLQEAGADAIQIRSQWLGYHIAYLPETLFYPGPAIPLKYFPKEIYRGRRGAGANIKLTAAMKKILHIPVISVGRFDPELGEKTLREGKADFIAMTRRLVADPELPNKIAAGRRYAIAPCTACGTCQSPKSIDGQKARSRCRINASFGTAQYTIEKTDKKKKVLVIGGGPAGMESARVAALRGHEVTLYERTSRPGGALPLAALVKGVETENLPAIVKYLKTQIYELGVKVVLGKDADEATIEQIKPDAIVLATGGLPATPPIKGIENPIVVSNTKLYRMLKTYLRFASPRTLRWLTKLWMPMGKRVIIIGGDIHGCELAEFLVKRGRKVVIVDKGEAFGEGMPEHLRGLLLPWFRDKGVVMVSRVKDMEVTERGLNIITKDDYREFIPADTIIPATSLQPDKELIKKLEGKAGEIYIIGDCKEPRLIVDAIAEGNRVGRAL
ncbi:MAG: FAD-dependent oxidoreductase [Dehalococcoidales bacterium]|jgi:2,4-dienoyl-CoA reductase (NADPH2)